MKSLYESRFFLLLTLSMAGLVACSGGNDDGDAAQGPGEMSAGAEDAGDPLGDAGDPSRDPGDGEGDSGGGLPDASDDADPDSSAPASPFVIHSSPYDYVLRDEPIPNIWALAPSSDKHLVAAGIGNDYVLRRERAIIQFDISEMEAPAEKATFSVYLYKIQPSDMHDGPPSYDALLFGSSQMRAEAIGPGYGDYPAPSDHVDLIGEMDSSLYSLIEGTLVSKTDEDAEYYSLDVTDFINARYADYRDGKGKVVVFRVQPSTDKAEVDNRGTRYCFKAGTAPEDLRPKLEITPAN